MAEQKKQQETEEQSQQERREHEAREEPVPTAGTDKDDDVHAYGSEPSDGSGGKP